MNTQEAHDIVNKEINVILKGCGDDFSNPCSAYRMCCKGDLCYDCKSKLKGIISMEASEIEDKEKGCDRPIENYCFCGEISFDNKILLCDDCNVKRLQALKISINDLKEKVK